MARGERGGVGVLAGGLGLTLLWAYQSSPLLACLGGCYPDYLALRGGVLGRVEVADARLNSWILGWVQHALTTAPGSLFDANIFYPVRNVLAASEHLLGIAVPLLPFGALGAGPVALHQIALVGSFLLGALASFALVRWLTASSTAASVAGAAALFMPWRISELSHIQLLCSMWFPLSWLMLGRVLYGDRPRAAAAWFAALCSLQVLTSFYLAYFLLASCLLLVPVLWVFAGRGRGALPRLAAAAVPPAVCLALAALPYLAWQRASGFVPVAELFDSVAPADAWSMLRPRLAPGLATELPRPISYGVPLAVCALALAALLPAGPADARGRRQRGFAVGLWLLAGAALVLVLGRELELGGRSFSLPAAWLAGLVPGFDNLRSPLRWLLLVGIGFPILAGLGSWRLEQLARARLGRRAVPALRLVVATSLLLWLPWGRIPAKPVWSDPDAIERVYAALAHLPDAPVVEIPWPLGIPRNVELASRYLLGSTRHWKPIANGSSGYYPRSYAFLSEVASRLPEPAALAQLRRLLDARWIVVHGDQMEPSERRAWAQAVQEGRLAPVFGRGLQRIYELPQDAESGRYMQALLSDEPRPRTFAGLARTPLFLPEPAGRLEAEARGPWLVRGGNRIPRLVELRITNTSGVTWPGFDLDPEGLVRVRYTFEANGGDVLTEMAPLIVDLPPGTTTTSAALRPPARPGRYRLRLELVQEQQAGARRLPVEPALLEVPVQEAGPPGSER